MAGGQVIPLLLSPQEEPGDPPTPSQAASAQAAHGGLCAWEEELGAAPLAALVPMENGTS